MTKFVRLFSVLTLFAVALAATSASAQEKKERGKRGSGGNDPFRLSRSLNLTEEQQKKVAELKEKFGSKLADAQKKAQLTEDQRRAASEAGQKARAEGKRGAELRSAIQEATKLTDEQKKGQEELTAVSREIREAINEILTEEQRAKQKESGRKGKGQRKPKDA